MKFVHLHVHSHYSLLDGLPKIKDLVEYAAKLGYEALALTDHGNLSGAIEFYKYCQKFNIKPIIGVEAYVAPRSRFLKESKVDAANYHLILLAENETGLKNLYKLISKAWLEGFYYRPRIDKDLLRENHEGLIALSGCPSGEIGRKILANDFEGALKTAQEYEAIFGKGNFFIELGIHPNLEDSRKLEKALIKLSEITQIPLVATQDSHYLNKNDAKIHDVFIAIQTGKNIDDESRLSLKNDDFSLSSEEEILLKFKNYPSAIKNTLLINERCNLKINFGQIKIPKYPLPEKETPESYLYKLINIGLSKKGIHLNDKIKQRIDYEFSVITKTGFASYFLIVQDIVNWAKEKSIFVGPGRGSAAGSLIAYLLNITEIDPLKYNLLFERFLTPERINFPDIDIDLPDTRRDEILTYLKTKYGNDHVAQIITFGKMASRAAIRDAGRALGYSYSFCDKIARFIPPNFSLEEAQNLIEIKNILSTSDEAKKLFEIAQKLEGTIRHASVHACGVVITPEPLTEYLPLQFAPQDQKRTITQYDMYAIDDLGLLKIDLLGLRTLSIIETAKNIIKSRKGIQIKLDVENKDPKTYELISQGKTDGVFQLESSGMKRFLKTLKPTEIEDLINAIALYRPGPMDLIPSFIKRRAGREEITYLHPKLEPILKSTYGIAVFQEQLMQIAKDLAGFSPSEADTLRKAVGKKIGELLEIEGRKLIEGMIKNGIDQKIAEKIWEWFKPFARYGFNRSHAVCYAYISYYTAYLKANFPVEFITACLIHEGTDIEKIEKYLNDARNNFQIRVLPADINESFEYFTIIDDKTIRFGLLSIKNIGEPLVKEIIRERETNGKFQSINDFIRRIKHKDLNKKSLESLIKSGVFDSLHTREELYFNIEELLNYSQRVRSIFISSSLFGSDSTKSIPKYKYELKKIDKLTKLKWERELLGVYISGHPFEEFEKFIRGQVMSIKMIKKTSASGSEIFVAGVINKIKRSLTKSKEPFAILEIEDLEDKIEVIMFPKIYEKYYQLLEEGRVVKVKGKTDLRSDNLCLIADEIEDISLLPSIKNNLTKNFK